MASVQDTLAALYGELPTVACRGLCHAECRSPVAAHPVERRAIERASGRPFVYHAVERRCTYLDASQRCSAYAHRPYVCRAYGSAAALACPHGCETSGTLTDDQARSHLHTLEQLSGNKRGAIVRVVR